MEWPSKQGWLDFAEVLDALRLFPRLFMAWFLWILTDIHLDYAAAMMGKAPSDFYVAAVYGIAGVLFGLYLNSGRHWGEDHHATHQRQGMFGRFGRGRGHNNVPQATETDLPGTDTEGTVG